MNFKKLDKGPLILQPIKIPKEIKYFNDSEDDSEKENMIKEINKMKRFVT